MLKTYQDMLLNPARWKLISSLCPPDLDTIEDDTHAAWLHKSEDMHPAREILFVLQGQTVFSLNDKVYPALPGTAFAFGSYERHIKQYLPDGSSSIHLWFYFVADQHVVAHLLEVNNGRTKLLFNRLLWENGGLINWFNQLWTQAAQSTMPPAIKRQKMLSLLALLLAETLETEYRTGVEQTRQQMTHELSMLVVNRHICQTAGRGLTIDNLALLSGYSKFHLTRLFKKHTGMTIHQAINHARHAKAAQMLQAGAKHKQIAHMLGFSSLSAYSHWHREHAQAIAQLQADALTANAPSS